MLRKARLGLALVVAGAAGGVALGQHYAAAQLAPPPAGIKRNILQKMDVPGTNLEVVVAHIEVAANFKAGRHTHPGDVTGYVIEGEFSIFLDGQPAKQLKAGQSLLVPSGAIHDEGTGALPAKLIGVYVVEKGKPLATPVK